jgi:uncharacterized protein YbgA (DUF1722 family)/uncharacterized protein YbbK (DUF523 family)
MSGEGEEKIPIGISTCLLGEKVRYDGGHKHDRFITQTLGRFFRFVPVCPEVECGLPVPRESMRLEGDPAHPRLITHKTKTDHTERMRGWGKGRLEELASADLCGYIFKSKSPSSGMERIKIYGEGGSIYPKGRGIWAAMFMDRFPLLPVEDEGRLHDPRLRENFIERVFVMKRWRAAEAGRRTRGGLVDFHTRHKLLILSHDVEAYRRLGRLVGRAPDLSLDELFARYLELLSEALKKQATERKHANVLQHLLGYFKKQLSGDEKQEVLDLIDRYKEGLLPLVVPVTLINHYVRKYGEPYLERQVYLNPHPVELKLRTHV